MSSLNSLEAEIRSRLSDQRSIDADAIEVEVSGDTATLNGSVPSFWAKIYAEQQAASFSEIVHVDNRLQVDVGTSEGDDVITDEITENLRLSEQLDPTTVDIAVHGGCVTLTGTVPSESAKQVVFNYAVSANGVRDVRNELQVRPA